MPGLTQLVLKLETLGWKVAIASGGFTFFVEYLRDKLRLTAVVANELEIMDGKFTGNVIGDIVDAQYKAKTLTRLAQEYEIPLAQTVAIGDGANDLDDQSSRLGIAYHAKPKVNEKAEVTIRHADLMGILRIFRQPESEVIARPPSCGRHSINEVHHQQNFRKRAFVCNECGADYPRWQGQCSACHAWNTITEVRLAASPTVARNERLSGYAGSAGVAKVQKLSDISLEELPRFSTGFKEFDRVLGGGVVPGSAILIGGNPGAGKSTLLLQTLCKLAQQMKTLYVTGEESLQQVAMRAHRLGLPTDNLNMLSETSIEQICLIAEEEQPKLMVIDSIQVMHMADVQSSPGSVAQVRETAAYLTRFAKTRGVAIVMVGHVTKDGSLAGPKVLEHCIDCSVLLDGDADSRFRTLRGR